MSRQRQAAELAALLDELLKAVDLFQAVMFLDGEWACEGLQFLDPSADVAAIVARAVVLAGRLSLPVPDSLLKYQYSGHSLTEAVKPRDAGLFRTGDGWRNWEAMRFIDWKFEWDKPVIVLRNAARQIAAENHTGGNGGSSVGSRMEAKLAEDPLAYRWSQRQWADYLSCSKTAVHNSQTWRTLIKGVKSFNQVPMDRRGKWRGQ